MGKQDSFVQTLFPATGNRFQGTGLPFSYENAGHYCSKDFARRFGDALVESSRFSGHLCQLGTRLQHLVYGIGTPALHTRATGYGFPARFHLRV